MTKDNLVFGLLGVIAGIILGVVVAKQSLSPAVNTISPTQPVQQQATQQGAQEEQLPDGHPPVDNATLLRELKTQMAILEQDPNNQQALVSAANLNYDMKNYKEASVYYEKAVKNDPKNVNLLTDLGTSYFYSGNAQSALAKYQESLSIDPRHMQTLMNVGVVKMQLGDRKGAADSWEKVVTFYPEAPEAARLKQSIQQLRAEQ